MFVEDLQHTRYGVGTFTWLLSIESLCNLSSKEGQF